jgi:hypothetical protein
MKAGDRVIVRDAFEHHWPATAKSGVEGTHELRDGKYRKIHDFPVVWVHVDGTDNAVPWPAEDVGEAE